jgi:hypothetical protein
MLTKPAIAGVLFFGVVQTMDSQTCSHSSNTSFYEKNGYTINKIRIESPFSFFFLVRQRLNEIKARLPIVEGGPFLTRPYNESFEIVREAVQADSAFGANSPIKIVVSVGGIDLCQEGESAPKTLDVVYRVFSTDPIPAARAGLDGRQTAIKESATTIAEQNTVPNYKVRPLIGYDHTYKGIGGGDVMVRIPGKHLSDFHFSGAGSSTSLLLDAELNTYSTLHLRALDLAEFHIGYHYLESPALALRLAQGSGHARFSGVSKPIHSAAAMFSLRYGASLEQGLQQSSLPEAMVADVITNSAYGALRFYGGIAGTTRYSDTAISYGLEAGGAGLSKLSFVKQLGDVTYGIRLPSRSHSAWDMHIRVTGGGIVGGPVLLNERFFGGNVVTSFIPGDPWRIPNGPLLRSLPANTLVGNGIGGTSFYSSNLTVGKVIKFSPMIPASIENAEGFASGIAAAENTAETFFADDYEADSPEFKQLTTEFTAKLSSDLTTVEGILNGIQAVGGSNSELPKALSEAQRQARLSHNFVNHLNDPNVRASDKALKLRTVNDPRNSKFIKLLQAMTALSALVPPDVRSELETSKATLSKDVGDLAREIDAIHMGPVRHAAELQAQKDMVRPRDTIDTLRFEANRIAFGLIGIFDVGRIWPDAYGTRYGIGGGGRISVVNVNLNVTYCVNPNPQKALGQGRGALLFSLTYTNLFH